jgi:hypothetical protein
MATNPRGRKARRRNDIQREKSRKGVEARARLRRERAEAWRDVGGFVTDGALGRHVVRLLAREGYGPRLAVTVDGEHRDARTLRGVVRRMGIMVWGGMATGGVLCATGA